MLVMTVSLGLLPSNCPTIPGETQNAACTPEKVALQHGRYMDIKIIIIAHHTIENTLC